MTTHDLEVALAAADRASARWRGLDLVERSKHIYAVANALDAHADQLIAIAMEESHLAEGRLRGELKRTTFQLKFLADEISTGRPLDIRLDSPDAQWPMGVARPDLRRFNIPIGPVLVFAASNFPFAFSIAGGDTAAALAAGCPVIVKAHHGHPRLSVETARVMQDALVVSGAPDGVLTLITGTQNGVDALKDARVKAAAFTGSIGGGRALFDIAQQRPNPIPFFGELGSNNPVFVTAEASAQNGKEIAEQFIASVTGSSGQLCTKPGTLFVPRNSSIVRQLNGAQLPPAQKLLTERIEAQYISDLQDVADDAKLTVLAGESSNRSAQPMIAQASMKDVLNQPKEMLSERFGPFSLVVEYESAEQLVEVARVLEGQLTATIIGTETCEVQDLLEILMDKAGRVLWNSWPTGVSVTHAQQHGGPYPASTASQTTSVGSAAISRFLRPVALQGFPQRLLPTVVSDDAPERIARAHG